MKPSDYLASLRREPEQRCPKCKGLGYTGWTHELTPVIEMLRHGVACRCAAGAKFAEHQAEFMKQGEQSEWPMINVRGGSKSIR